MFNTKTNIYAMLLLFAFFSFKKTKAQDWPNLQRYQQANQELMVDKDHKAKVVFMGNSITEQWLSANPSFFSKAGHINRGIGGQTTPQMLLRFRQDVVQLNPKAVVILAGTNDIAENTGPISLAQIRDNILSMVQLAKANGITPIVCSVLPAYDYPWRPGKQPNVKIPQLNGLLLSMCQAESVPYLDYFASMADDRNGLPKAYTTDEVHLTPAGYKVMEQMVTTTLKEVLKK